MDAVGVCCSRYLFNHHLSHKGKVSNNLGPLPHMYWYGIPIFIGHFMFVCTKVEVKLQVYPCMKLLLKKIMRKPLN